MNAPAVLAAEVPPVIRRHAEDAAFYWQQLDNGFTAVSLNASRALHFAQLLDAHLEGLAVSGTSGCVATWEALQRWRKPGEAFAAMWSALAARDAAAQEGVIGRVAAMPDLLLRGAISALAWHPVALTRDWLDAALDGDEPVRLVAALRALALHGATVPAWPRFARHEDLSVRAAACRCAGAQDLPGLAALGADACIEVRVEAAIAMLRVMPRDEHGATGQAQVAGRLWQGVEDQVRYLAGTTGWNRMQAQRRLRRWLRHLAWAAPLGHPGVQALLQQLPLRAALDFALHHADAAVLPFVLRALQDPEHGRWAGWVWQALTGVSLVEHGLVLPDPPVDLDAPLTPQQHDADQGLPLPDAEAVASHPASQQDPRDADGRPQRLLLGQPVTPQRLLAVLDPQADASQALRGVAAFALAQLQPERVLNLRASLEQQARQLEALHAPAVEPPA